jgi:hypothetical protein
LKGLKDILALKFKKEENNKSFKSDLVVITLVIVMDIIIGSEYLIETNIFFVLLLLNCFAAVNLTTHLIDILRKEKETLSKRKRNVYIVFIFSSNILIISIINFEIMLIGMGLPLAFSLMVFFNTYILKSK